MFVDESHQRVGLGLPHAGTSKPIGVSVFPNPSDREENLSSPVAGYRLDRSGTRNEALLLRAFRVPSNAYAMSVAATVAPRFQQASRSAVLGLPETTTSWQRISRRWA